MARPGPLSGTYRVLHHGVEQELRVSKREGEWTVAYADGLTFTCNQADAVRAYLERDQAERIPRKRRG